MTFSYAGDSVFSNEDLALRDEDGYVFCTMPSLRNNAPPRHKRSLTSRYGPDNRTAALGVTVSGFSWCIIQCSRRIANRQDSPRVRAIVGANRRLVTIDQGGVNLPEQPAREYSGQGFHFDVSVELPTAFGVQGTFIFSNCGSMRRKRSSWRAIAKESSPVSIAPFDPRTARARVLQDGPVIRAWLDHLDANPIPRKQRIFSCVAGFRGRRARHLRQCRRRSGSISNESILKCAPTCAEFDVALEELASNLGFILKRIVVDRAIMTSCCDSAPIKWRTRRSRLFLPRSGNNLG